MLKLVSNKNGTEVHQLEVTKNGGSTIQPAFQGVTGIVDACNGDKQQILNALSQFNPEYVWAVTYEEPSAPALTRRQFRLALVMNDFDLADIEALIEQIPDEMQKQIIKVEWQDATVFERNNPNLIAMADLMELSETQIDTLWEQAATL